MKFFEVLKPQDFGMGDRVHNGHTYRQFAGIMLDDNLWLSIQASFAHYCTPRETLDDLNAYTRWELALFTKDDWVRVTDVLPDFLSLSEIELYFEGSVYPYVPTDLVEELYVSLKLKYNKLH